MGTILRTNHLTKKYGTHCVVKDLSLTVQEGDIYGFIGKNGAGKTTLIRMIAGLAKPTEGNLLLFGGQNLTAARAAIGTVIENPALYPNMSARNNMMAQVKLKGESPEQIDRLLELVGLGDTGRKKAKNFSLGMRQRLAIAIALIGSPKFLILDEPTNGLDPQGIREIRELIIKLNQEEKITVLISSHILSELSKFATRYGIIHNGQLIEEFTEQELWERHRENETVQDNDLEDYFLQKISGM